MATKNSCETEVLKSRAKTPIYHFLVEHRVEMSDRYVALPEMVPKSVLA